MTNLKDEVGAGTRPRTNGDGRVAIRRRGFAARAFAGPLAALLAMGALGCGSPEDPDGEVATTQHPIVIGSDVIYDGLNGPATQCPNLAVHCCPTGYAMVGAHVDQNVFKCARLSGPIPIGGPPPQLNIRGPGDVSRLGVHACHPNEVMVGYHHGADWLICRTPPVGGGYTEWTDKYSRDTFFRMHICPTAGAAMSGINYATNTFACLNEAIP